MSKYEIWIPFTLRNLVYETIARLTKNGRTPITEVDLLLYLENQGYRVTRREVVNILMELETHGYIRVKSSGAKERIILFMREEQD